MVRRTVRSDLRRNKQVGAHPSNQFSLGSVASVPKAAVQKETRMLKGFAVPRAAGSDIAE
jgi:hypothetical protein